MKTPQLIIYKGVQNPISKVSNFDIRINPQNVFVLIKDRTGSEKKKLTFGNGITQLGNDLYIDWGMDNFTKSIYEAEINLGITKKIFQILVQ